MKSSRSTTSVSSTSTSGSESSSENESEISAPCPKINYTIPNAAARPRNLPHQFMPPAKKPLPPKQLPYHGPRPAKPNTRGFDNYAYNNTTMAPRYYPYQNMFQKPVNDAHLQPEFYHVNYMMQYHEPKNKLMKGEKPSVPYPVYEYNANGSLQFSNMRQYQPGVHRVAYHQPGYYQTHSNASTLSYDALNNISTFDLTQNGQYSKTKTDVSLENDLKFINMKALGSKSNIKSESNDDERPTIDPELQNMSKIDFKNAIVHQKRSKLCKKAAIITLAVIIIAVLTTVAAVIGVMLSKTSVMPTARLIASNVSETMNENSTTIMTKIIDTNANMTSNLTSTVTRLSSTQVTSLIQNLNATTHSLNKTYTAKTTNEPIDTTVTTQLPVIIAEQVLNLASRKFGARKSLV